MSALLRSSLIATLALLACTSSDPRSTPPTRAPAEAPAVEQPREAASEAEPGPSMRNLVVTDDGGCVIRAGHGVWCWGGDLYPGLDVPLGIARQVELGDGDPKSIALNRLHLCGLFPQAGEADLVRCVESLSTKDFASPLETARELVVLDGLACVLNDGGLSCIGGDWFSAPNVVDVTKASTRTCLLDKAGEVRCAAGIQLDKAEHSFANPEIAKIASNGDEVCALLRSGTIQCPSGFMGFEAIGTAWATRPELVDVVDFGLGSDHGCALDRAGKVKCWGDNRVAQLGVGDTSAHAEVVDVPLPGPALELAVASNKTCALLADQILCWGQDGGFGHPRIARHRQAFESDALRVDAVLSCARNPEQEWWCWGSPSGLGVADEYGGLLTAAQPRRATVEPMPDEIMPEYVRIGTEVRMAELSDQLDALIETDVRARKTRIAGFVADIFTRCVLSKSNTATCEQEPEFAWLRRFSLTKVEAVVINDPFEFVCVLRKREVMCRQPYPSKWTKVAGLSDAVELVELGTGHICARRSDGTVACYGVWADRLVELPVTDAVDIGSGFGTVFIHTARGSLEFADIDNDQPLRQLIPAGVVELDHGWSHACVRLDEDADGRSEALECIGDARYGRLGVVGDAVSLRPRAIEFPARFPIELPAIGGR